MGVPRPHSTPWGLHTKETSWETMFSVSLFAKTFTSQHQVIYDDGDDDNDQNDDVDDDDDDS